MSTETSDVRGSDRVRRGPYEKGRQRRQQILDQALTVFDQQGVEGTSLRAVGAAIGVDHATLRHYFGSREELFLAVLEAADRRATETMSTTDHRATGFATEMADYSMKVPGLTALFSAMTSRALETDNEHSRAFFVERYEKLRAQVIAILETGRALGKVRTDVPLDTAAALVIAASDGMSTQWLLDPDVDMREGMALLDRLLTPG